ncbi:carbohydrate sulfotransferase 15-like [Mercenaria mercenaria]|uniref:carbohydrate sulfotransferase 15-like n=1 Tax=Mercenaria mercenaria TaxID=6596 RepID=UPI00234E6564|nr:carbohydrate sulfotransferase 15-like [Mercenaria mercenaria]
MENLAKYSLIIILAVFFAFCFTVRMTPLSKNEFQQKDIPPMREKLNGSNFSETYRRLDTTTVKAAKTPHPTETENRRHAETYRRLDTTPEKTEHLPFLQDFKNPCWREADSNSRMCIRCLPYFYLVGAPKCGTTDLFRRLVKHPLISDKCPKEPHWITRKRFTGGVKKQLSDYLVYFDSAVQKDISRIEADGYHNAIFGDCSASTLWDNSNLLRAEKSKNMTTPPFTNANIIYHLNKHTKIIIILRNPISRLYSDYIYFNKEYASAADFHNRVVAMTGLFSSCLKIHSLRYCAYFFHYTVRIHLGFYHVYIEDYLRVFPKEQIKIIKLEDYAKDKNKSMTDVFNFLGTGLPPKRLMEKIAQHAKANTNWQRKVEVGEMWQKTYKLLYDFYKPFNDQLVKLLGNKFNYN